MEPKRRQQLRRQRRAARQSGRQLGQGISAYQAAVAAPIEALKGLAQVLQGWAQAVHPFGRKDLP